MSAESNVARHYEELLADVYSWMQGGAAARVEENRAFFERHDIRPHQTGRALDIGAGSGFQTLPLVERGFAVTAVDLSEKLLAELRARAGASPVDTVRRDALGLPEYVRGPLDLIVCMGDTLLHLESAARVRALLEESWRQLVPGGRLVLTLRDLTTLPEGNGRFLPVRSDLERIFTCFLEEIDGERVRVHDVLHVRYGDHFRQHVGSYVKLRLSPEWIDRELLASGFTLTFSSSERGIVTRIASR